MSLLTYIKQISPRLVLIIAGERTHSAQPKELVIIPGAVHVDLHHKLDVIPSGKLETFFEENLKVDLAVNANAEPTKGK